MNKIASNVWNLGEYEQVYWGSRFEVPLGQEHEFKLDLLLEAVAILRKYDWLNLSYQGIDLHPYIREESDLLDNRELARLNTPRLNGAISALKKMTLKYGGEWHPHPQSRAHDLVTDEGVFEKTLAD